jgi:hypothetical protein
VGFLALSLEPDAKRVATAAREMELSLPIALARGEMLGPLGVRAVPSTVILDANGSVAAVASGARKRAWFTARLRELVAPKK